MMFDHILCAGLAREQEGFNGSVAGRNSHGRRYPGDERVVDGAGTARHASYQTNGGCAQVDGHSRFLRAADAADLHDGHAAKIDAYLASKPSRMRGLRPVILSASLLPAVPTASAQIASDDAMLEAFGASLGMMLYNTYLAIGSVGDAYEAEAYDAATVTALMDEQMNSMSTVGGQLRQLDDVLVLEDEADRVFVRDAVLVIDDLNSMARHMKAYANSLATADADAFQSARSGAWGKIAVLLGIEVDDQ
jgi:hypothetical protein